MNTTFELEPSTSVENDNNKAKPKTYGGKPPKIPRQTTYSGRTALAALQLDLDESTEEFEKPRFFRKSVSAGMLRKKRSSDGEVKEKSDGESEVSDEKDSFSKKKRRLNDPKANYMS